MLTLFELSLPLIADYVYVCTYIYIYIYTHTYIQQSNNTVLSNTSIQSMQIIHKQHQIILAPLITVYRHGATPRRQGAEGEGALLRDKLAYHNMFVCNIIILYYITVYTYVYIYVYI